MTDIDMQLRGEVTEGTLEAIVTQGYSYKDGQLTKQSDQTESVEQTEQEAQPEETVKMSETAPTYYIIKEAVARRVKKMNSYSDYRQ